jgi:hypothetical protein
VAPNPRIFFSFTAWSFIFFKLEGKGKKGTGWKCATSMMKTNFNKGGNNLEFEFNVSMFRWRRGNERFSSQMPKVQPGPGYTSL